MMKNLRNKKGKAVVRSGLCLLISALLCVAMLGIGAGIGDSSQNTAHGETVNEIPLPSTSSSQSAESSTLTPTPRQTLTAEGTPSTEATASPEATATAQATVSPEATATAQATVSPEATASAEITPAPTLPIHVDAAIAPIALNDSASQGVSADVAENAAVVGQGDTVKDYEQLAGSVYIRELGKNITYSNEDGKNAIQAALTDALTYAKGLCENGTSATATLVVSEGTYQGGIDLTEENTDSALTSLIKQILDLNTTGEKTFTINIAAEDAIEENEDGSVGFHAQSEGKAALEGDVNVNMKGLNLVLAGLYYSTRGLVKVENANSVEIYGTAQDDVITVEAEGVKDHVKIDSGKGSDKVKARVSKQTAGFEVKVDLAQAKTAIGQLAGITELVRENKPEEMADSVFEFMQTVMNGIDSTIAGSFSERSTLKVDVLLGDGDDIADVKLIDASDIKLTVTPDAAGSLTNGVADFTFALDMNAAELTVDGGNGSDTLKISGGKECTLAQSLTQAVTEYVLKTDVELPDTRISVFGNQGDDTIDLSTTAAFATWGSTEINVDAGAGFDRVNLSGKLNDKVSEDMRITANAAHTEFNVNALAQITFLKSATDLLDVNDLSIDLRKSFAIKTVNADAFTDTLKNKRTVRIENIAEGDFAQDFTDYILTPEYTSEGEAKVDFDIADTALKFNGSAFMSNLTLDLSDAEDGATLTVEKLSAPELNLMIDSDSLNGITLGDLNGRNVIVSLNGTDAAIAELDLDVVHSDLDEEENIEIQFGLYEASRKLTVDVTGTVRTAEAVAITSELTLNKAFIPGADLLEFSQAARLKSSPK